MASDVRFIPLRDLVVAVGRLTKMVDPTGSENYSYDSSGRQTQIAKIVNGQSYSIRYQYDAGGDIAQITYPSGRVIYQAHNQVGQLCQIAPSAGNCTPASSYYAANLGYNSSGKLTSFRYGNGVNAAYYYSPDRTQLAYLAYSKGNSTYFGLQYSYRQNSPYSPPCSNGTTGNNGSIQCITDSVDSGRSVGYGYDPVQRMNAAKTCGSSAFPQWGLTEAYDRFGNRWSQTATAGTLPQPSLTFNNNNQPIGYAFDASGNMTGDPLLGAMNYDGENRKTVFNGGSTVTYTYDGNGLRVVRSVSSGTTTVSIFSGSSVLAQYDDGAAPGSPSREYVYGGLGLLAMFSGGTTTYYHQDHLSVRLTTDADGNVIRQQGTFPFGESWYQSGLGNNFVFTSYDRDPETGLDYALARDYDSTTGTFIMADPVAGNPNDPQSWNRYAYSRNDPINFTDPTGQHWWDWLITGAAIGADIFTAGASDALWGLAESLAINYASNAIQGQYGFGLKDVEGAAIGGALTGAETKYLGGFLPDSTLAKAPIHFGERAFNSFVSNEALNGQARVDWIGTAIGTGLDILNDYANGRPCLNRRANATDVANGAGGDLTNNAPPSPVGGHEEYATDVTPAQLTAKGYDAFSILGHADGYHNTSLFMQPHFNLMDGGGYQVHFDMFNPHAGAAGLGLHGVVDLGIGSLFFKHSTVLDPGC